MLLSRKVPSGLGIFQDIVAFQEAELVTGDEVGGVGCDQIRRL